MPTAGNQLAPFLASETVPQVTTAATFGKPCARSKWSGHQNLAASPLHCRAEVPTTSVHMQALLDQRHSDVARTVESVAENQQRIHFHRTHVATGLLGTRHTVL